MMRGLVTLAFTVTEPNPTSGVELNGARINLAVAYSTGFSVFPLFLTGGVIDI